MPKVSVEHASSLPASEAFAKLKSYFENDKDIRRLDPKIECKFTDSAMTGKATGSQFKADLTVKSKGSGSQIEVVVDLPFLLTPFKTKIQESIQKNLAKHIA